MQEVKITNQAAPAIPIGKAVKLDPVDEEMICRVAERRRESCQSRNAKNEMRSLTESDQDERERLGVAGEVVAAYLFGVRPDLSESPRSGGADLIVGGCRVDVKTTDCDESRLGLGSTPRLLTNKQDATVDAYVLIWYRRNHDAFEYRGWIDSKTVDEQEPKRSGNKSNPYRVGTRYVTGETLKGGTPFVVSQ